MSGFRIDRVTPGLINQAWPLVSGYLEQSTNKSGDLTLEELEAGIRSGLWPLFVGTRDGEILMAVVLSMENHARGRVANVLAWGGESPLDDWGNDSVEATAEQAKSLGATLLFMIGHRGLERKLKAIRPVKTIYERVL